MKGKPIGEQHEKQNLKESYASSLEGSNTRNLAFHKFNESKKTYMKLKEENVNEAKGRKRK